MVSDIDEFDNWPDGELGLLPDDVFKKYPLCLDGNNIDYDEECADGNHSAIN